MSACAWALTRPRSACKRLPALRRCRLAHGKALSADRFKKTTRPPSVLAWAQWLAHALPAQLPERGTQVHILSAFCAPLQLRLQRLPARRGIPAPPVGCAVSRRLPWAAQMARPPPRRQPHATAWPMRAASKARTVCAALLTVSVVAAALHERRSGYRHCSRCAIGAQQGGARASAWALRPGSAAFYPVCTVDRIGRPCGVYGWGAAAVAAFARRGSTACLHTAVYSRAIDIWCQLSRNVTDGPQNVVCRV